MKSSVVDIVNLIVSPIPGLKAIRGSNSAGTRLLSPLGAESQIR